MDASPSSTSKSPGAIGALSNAASVSLPLSLLGGSLAALPGHAANS
jgi:hypothetical protein